MLRIADWENNFENASSRKLKRLDWVPLPNRMDGAGYTALVDHPNGAAHLGAWIAIVEIASRQTVRGTLPDGVGGICRCLGRISRLPGGIFEEAIPRLLEIGWLEQIQQLTEDLPQSADALAESPTSSAKSVSTGKGMEGNGRETHTQEAAVCAPPKIAFMPTKPTAADLTEPVSTRFEEFWAQYPRKQRRDFACREWLSIVTSATEGAVFACLARYLASDEVTRGIVANPDKWLYEQHRNGWAGDWPRAPSTAVANHKQSRLKEIIEAL